MKKILRGVSTLFSLEKVSLIKGNFDTLWKWFGRTGKRHTGIHSWGNQRMLS